MYSALFRSCQLATIVYKRGKWLIAGKNAWNVSIFVKAVFMEEKILSGQQIKHIGWVFIMYACVCLITKETETLFATSGSKKVRDGEGAFPVDEKVWVQEVAYISSSRYKWIIPKISNINSSKDKHKGCYGRTLLRT